MLAILGLAPCEVDQEGQIAAEQPPTTCSRQSHKATLRAPLRAHLPLAASRHHMPHHALSDHAQRRRRQDAAPGPARGDCRGGGRVRWRALLSVALWHNVSMRALAIALCLIATPALANRHSQPAVRLGERAIMTNSPATDAPCDQPPPDVPKVRQCLRCNATFPSEWSGERICSRCKSSNAWRSGVPLTSHPSSNKR